MHRDPCLSILPDAMVLRGKVVAAFDDEAKIVKRTKWEKKDEEPK